MNCHGSKTHLKSDVHYSFEICKFNCDVMKQNIHMTSSDPFLSFIFEYIKLWYELCSLVNLFIQNILPLQHYESFWCSQVQENGGRFSSQVQSSIYNN